MTNKRPPNAQLTHLGFQVRDLEAMIDFYTRVIGLALTDRGPYYRGGEIAFLSRDPAEHHQVVLASGRTPEMGTIINQISFIVDSLEELCEFYVMLVEEKVKELAPRNHGNAWSIYFHDPEGNRIELYAPTPWHVGQPYGRPLDLTQSAELLRQLTFEMIRDDPTFRPRESWELEMKSLMERKT
ncbi:MAG: VOC family protein [Burkholderiales bacterium]